jgi:hypothetical protein
MNLEVVEDKTGGQVVKALIKAQVEMGRLIKNATNPHLKSKYADLGSVIDASFDALHSNGFAVVQACGADDRGQFVDTVLIHESGERLTSRVYLRIAKDDMQGLGSAITYARRYGLLGLAGLAPEDDDGQGTTKPTAKPENKPAKQQEAHKPAILDKIGAMMADKSEEAKEHTRELIRRARKPDGSYNENALAVILADLEE